MVRYVEGTYIGYTLLCSETTKVALLNDTKNSLIITAAGICIPVD